MSDMLPSTDNKDNHEKIKSHRASARQGKAKAARKFGDPPKPPKKITETYLYNSGLYYLERFTASKAHFRKVMERKVRRSCKHHLDQDQEECFTLVAKTADKFEEMGLLNDALYTKGSVTSFRRRGLSRNAIISKMKHKGIEPDDTKNALTDIDESDHDTTRDAEIQAALTLARKRRIGPYFRGEEQDKNKSLGVFARAGYSYDIAKAILDMTHDDLDNMH